MTLETQSFEAQLEERLNNRTAFDREKRGIFDAFGYFDGSIEIILNKRFSEGGEFKTTTIREHSAPITDIRFIITDSYGVKLSKKYTNPSRLLLASSSYDETIIIWQLSNSQWFPALKFSLDDSYCTSISTNPNNPVIYFGLSNGQIKSFDLMEDSVDQRQIDDAKICYFVDSTYENDTEIIGKSNSDLEIKKGDESYIKRLSDDETNQIISIDVNSQYILVTCEDGTLFVFDRDSQESNKVEFPAELVQFKATMAKFEPVTQAIRVLNENGQIITLMKNPDNRTYRKM